MIEMISPTEFVLDNNGCQMWLKKAERGWILFDENRQISSPFVVIDTVGVNRTSDRQDDVQTVKFPTVEHFATLEQVEQHHASWQGIAAIVGSFKGQATDGDKGTKLI